MGLKDEMQVSESGSTSNPKNSPWQFEVDHFLIDKTGNVLPPLLVNIFSNPQIPLSDGVLVYIKPVFYGKESLDVFHYAQANKGFPHEPTSDLRFNESQFESYRQLGFYILESAITEICGEHWEWKGRSLNEFVERARFYGGEVAMSESR